jgi:parallel beta-helix repeat protein
MSVSASLSPVLRRLSLLLLCATLPAWAVARVPVLIYAVGNVQPLPPGAVQVARLLDVPWASLPPGTEVTVAPGTYSGPIMINARGSAALPITVHASLPSQPPLLTGSLDFQNASHVKINQVVITGSPYAAVVIRNASDHITIAHSTLSQSEMGVNISAGTGHLIKGNQILDNRTVGIGVDMVRADPADRTRIVGNTVLRSGHHGMEIRGSNYQIEGNVAAFNGQAIAGTSGIHLYSGGPGEDTGDGNIVRYNFAYANLDRGASDGNGIQADQWCDNNEIAFNAVWGNDGAGIIVFDGANNRVHNNTAVGNGVDSGHTHGGFGEIILNSAGAGTNRSQGNQLYDNLLIPTRPNVPGLYVDWITSFNANSFGPSLYHHRAGGPLLNWGGQLALTATRVDQLSGSQGALDEVPQFANEAAPLQGGLRLLRTPGSRGQVVKGQRDLAARLPGPGDSFLGAYFTAAGQ